MSRLATFLTLVLAPAAASLGCGDDGGISGNENELITAVVLTFSPEGGGSDLTFEVNDPDGDGGDPPVADPVDLPAGNYALAVRFENRLEDPPEDITEEVADESDQHQIFFTGTAVDGPASDVPGAPLTHAYADEDADGLPIGLESTIAAATGTGELTVTLRHLPPVNDAPTKTADVAAEVRDNGFSAIAGNSDAQVKFAVTVP